MNEITMARWQDWSGKSIEHLVLKEGADAVTADAAILGEMAGGIVVDSAIVGEVDKALFAARYQILCDARWRMRWANVALIGGDGLVELVSDGDGNWTDGSGMSLPQLSGAIDVDITVTPFTNTLPIRRLNLSNRQAGEFEEILVAYVDFELPDIIVITDHQRYTCLKQGKYYRFESLDSGFSRDIEVDERGLVVLYPGLFKRIL